MLSDSNGYVFPVERFVDSNYGYGIQDAFDTYNQLLTLTILALYLALLATVARIAKKDA
jgi:hypothetical protein